jgi:ectoine hydroxylase-related dioxygenase (phytanoyl-CoA dioxygenase family)
MQVVFALDDQSLENGCSLVAPGSHVSGEFADRAFKDLEPVEAEAGDLIVWDSRLWHGAAANTSGRSRWSLVATFRAWWAKQSMDIPRGLPNDLYRQLSDEQKALLGFCSIPPRNEHERISMKVSYVDLRQDVSDYFD